MTDEPPTGTAYPSRAAAARGIVLVCRRLWERGLIAGPDGNVSVRLAPDRLLATPSGRSKVDVTARDLVELDLDGGAVRAVRAGRAGRAVRPGSPRASSEIGMHLRIYARRPDVRAVVHAHPPTATGFAVAGESVMANVLPELILQMGRVPLVPYATPGTPALAEALEPYLADHDAFLLANHGATTVGTTLLEAHQRMESLEHGARILLTARMLGRTNELSETQVRELERGRRRR